jgi:hypothetical protein
MTNFININDPDAAIFRVFSRDRLLEVIRERKLTLVRPALWDDPFDNFLLNSEGELPDGRPVSMEGIRNQYYGQCWTLLEESDAIWRIYAPCKNGLKVKSTIRKVFDVVQNPGDPFASLSYFIGKVEYLTESEILSFMSDPQTSSGYLLNPQALGQVRSLLIKRQEFGHEQEVRLIYRANDYTGPDVVSFPVDPDSLFEEVVIDPRTPDVDYVALEAELRALGYKGKISQSPLYKVPKFRIKLP